MLDDAVKALVKSDSAFVMTFRIWWQTSTNSDMIVCAVWRIATNI